MCFISPSTKEEALQTATFTLVLATLLHELEHLAIHTWKYTTHRAGGWVGGGWVFKRNLGNSECAPQQLSILAVKSQKIKCA